MDTTSCSLKSAILFGVMLICLSWNCSKDKGDMLPRQKFIGSYEVNENCGSGNYSFSITITESSASEANIIITNFGNYKVNVAATVNGDNISINDTKNAIQFSGSGSINGNTLTIIYSASQGGDRDDCTATCIKQ